MNRPTEYISAFMIDSVYRFSIRLTHMRLRYEVNNVIYVEIIPNRLDDPAHFIAQFPIEKLCVSKI